MLLRPLAVNNDIDHLRLSAKAAHQTHHFVDHGEVTRDKEVICRPSESLVPVVLGERVSAGPYAGDHRYAVRPLCLTKIDKAANRSSRCQPCYQRNPSPPRGIQDLLTRAMKENINTDNRLRKIQRCIGALREHQSIGMMPGNDEVLESNSLDAFLSIIPRACAPHDYTNFMNKRGCHFIYDNPLILPTLIVMATCDMKELFIWAIGT